MQTQSLGPSGLRVSRAVLGTMTFGKQVDEAGAASMIDLCLERGVNFVDSANVYNTGVSETILGRILQNRRDQFVLASKVGIRMGDQPQDAGLSQRAIVYQIEQSLRRLQTDYVDIYYLHQPDPQVRLEESLSAMDQLVREGKARVLGASNYSAWQVCRMRWLADTNGWAPVQVMQPMYNLLARGIEPEFLPMCRALGLATVVYNPLAGGLLTGKHRPDQSPESGTRFDNNVVYQDRYWRPENFAAVERLQVAAAAEGRSLASLSLGWLLHHTATDCIILGASSLAQLASNLDALEQGPLSPPSLDICDDAWKGVRGISPRYHRD